MSFKREVEVLSGLQALAELRDMIIFPISVKLAGNKKRLEAQSLPKWQLNGRFSFGAAEAKLFLILHRLREEFIQ